MVAAVKFEAFGEDLAEKQHDLNADTLAVYLTNTTPSASLDAVKADLPEIATGNGYTGPQDVQNATSRTGGTTSVTGTDVTITAAGGPIGPFQWVVLDNETTVDKKLIQYWDYGGPVTLADGESLTIDFGPSLLDIA